MNGYWGQALVVDIGTGQAKELPIPDQWCRDFIGGEGFGVRLFWDLMKPDAEPLDPDQPLIFATGPLTGTAAPTSGRSCMVFHSPATGGLGLTNVGGKLSPALKKTGYDLIAVVGRAEKPVFLVIDDGSVDLRDASGIWGKGVTDTEDAIFAQLDGTGYQIASIGPAGEKGVMFSCIMTDKERAAGRGGAGAVMGAKNLKAMAVRGTKATPLADPEGLKQASKAARQELLTEHFVEEALKPFGTPGFYTPISETGTLPTKNWQRTTFPESHGTLGAEGYHSTLDVKPYACSGCPVGCGRHTTIKEGKYAGASGGGPEYETLGAFGAKCMVSDINTVAKASYVCNDLGMDTISAGQTIAVAMEWYEKGLLTASDTDGIDLSWGNAEALIPLVEKMAFREGIGDLLAGGVMRAAEELGEGAEDAAMHVKGLEMAACGVEASKGEAVVHAVSPRGADHLRPYASVIDAFGYRSEELGITGEIDFREDGNKEWVKPLQELSMATNLLGVCLFAVITLAVKASTWADLLSKATGESLTKDDLLKSAERVINMERLVNARFGFTREHDTLPKRLLTVPASDGPGEGEVVDLDSALDSHYKNMGWDTASGLPTEAKIAELGLAWMA